LALAVTPQMVNPQDASLNLQAAIKNLATNAVLYFVIPVALDALFVHNPVVLDLPGLAAAWKSIEESQEVSVIVNGFFFYIFIYLKFYLNNKKKNVWCI
jgi:hypothetical protein